MKVSVSKILKISLLLLYLFISQINIKAEGDGYGENPGGFGGDTVIVDNKQDFKSYAGSSEPYVILVKDTIDVGSEVRVRSFKTISGINPNSTVKGNINITAGVSNIIIKNLNITNPAEDGITIRNAKYILVNNCTVFDCADGCIDVTVASDFVTISNCRFYYEFVTFHKFVNLIGADDADTTDRGKLHVTFHSNWWDTGCTSRMPRVRFGYVHIYNSYFSCVGNNYCNRAGKEGHVFSERNYFDGVRDPLTAEDGGVVKSEGNKYENTSGTIHPGTDESFTPSYTYTTVSPLEAKEFTQNNAGNTVLSPVIETDKWETSITWNDQLSIIFGTPLSEVQLNASATGNTSSPVYSHPAGSILPEGYNTITVTFPEDENHKAASKTVNIRVKYDYYTLMVHTENATSSDLIKIEPEGRIIDGKLSYPLDSLVTLTATNNLLSTFDHWQNNSTNPILSVVMDENKEVIAYYKPLPFIAAWDFYNDGNKDRSADFYSLEVNKNSQLQLRDENGTSISWIEYAGSSLLEGKNAAMSRRGSSTADRYYFQIQFDATHFENIKVDANMLGTNTYYQIQNVEYSIDGTTFNKIGEYGLTKELVWFPNSFTLPLEANGAPSVVLRFKPDPNSPLISNGLTGTSISEVRILANKNESTPAQDTKLNLQVVEKRFFTLGGVQVKRPVKGINIIITRYEDGSSDVKKVLLESNAYSGFNGLINF